MLHVEPVVDEHGLEVLVPSIPEQARTVISLVARLLDPVAQDVEVLHPVESVETRPRDPRPHREPAFSELRAERSVHVQIGGGEIAEAWLRPGPNHVRAKKDDIPALPRHQLLERKRDGAEPAVRVEERRNRERPPGAVLVGDPVKCRSSQKDRLVDERPLGRVDEGIEQHVIECDGHPPPSRAVRRGGAGTDHRSRAGRS